MPFYEYICKNCKVFEVKKRPIEERDNPLECVGCGNPMSRQLDFGAVHFIGQGFYSKDKANEDTL